MSVITTATRMWLTRSLKPFQFKNEYDHKLDYSNTDHLGLYIHIPFCESICSFCPYCKERYVKERCHEYIDTLIAEIHHVGATADGTKKKVTSLYFGGGTPALAIDRLGDIIQAVEDHFIIAEGIGLELHPGNVTKENLRKLKTMGITKISIGIQSFQPKLLKLLGRSVIDPQNIFDAMREVPFETVSMDFIFALPGQTIEELKADIDMAFANQANHIAIYPFINFTFTKSTIPVMAKKEKRKLLDEITKYCESKGYHRDSIWTFAKKKRAKYSSMTRENFLGFGCSATTLLKDQFKINTFSIEEYKKRIAANDIPTSLTIRFTKRQRMIYYLFWTAYSTKIKAKNFEDFFGESLKKNYGFELWLAKKLGLVNEQDHVYTMTLKGAFDYHYYENYYTLAYIDKMWGIMRKEAFPQEINF
ncbi:MAG TPA: radical SAM protein [Clostridiales bacterium]|nr:radical SAM protein [Clostridiales bacterium]